MKTAVINNFNPPAILKETRPLRAVVYARVSTEEQTKQELSIPLMQIPECIKLVQKNGWKFIRTYTDAGKPCNSFNNRPELQQMLKDVDNYDVVVVWSFDRLYGDGDMTKAKIFEALDIAKKQLTSARQEAVIVAPETYDPKSLNATTNRNFNSIQVSYDRQIRRERLMRSKTETIQLGKQIFPACYGYKIFRKVNPRNDKRTIGYRIINKEESQILKRIFEERLKGMSLRQIAIGLNKEGIKTRKDKDWFPVRIGRILSNPFPCGYITYNKSEDRRFGDERVRTPFGNNKWKYIAISLEKEPYYKPIISEEVFKKVQEINKIRNNHKGKAVYSKNILAGLLKCPLCGSPMIASHYYKAKTPPFVRFTYTCSQWQEKRKCSNKCYTAHKIQKKVIMEVDKYLNDPELFENCYKANKVDKKEELKKEVAELETRLGKVQVRIYNLNLKYVDKKIQESYYQQLLSKFEEEERGLKGKIESVQGGINKMDEQKEKLISFKSLGKEIHTRFKKLDILQQKQILHTLIERIDLSPIWGKPKVIFQI